MPDTVRGLGIRLQNLTKTYHGLPTPAVEDVTLEIPAGELVVFVGPSGCGKTTTMKMINRLIEPTSGHIFLGDQDVTHANPDILRRGIGYVIQQTGLFPHVTIADNVATVPRLLGWDKKRISERVDYLLDLVGLPPGEYARRYPRQLSGGQQQRAGVARALAADPPVLLMDEPFGATDPITRVRLQREFRRLQQELGKTVVFVTHDFEEAVLLGDRIAVLAERSRIVQYDTPFALLGNPVDDYVRSFTGASAHLRMLGLVPVAGAALESGAFGGKSVGPEATLREVMDVLVAGAPAVDVRDHAGAVAGHLTFESVRTAVAQQVGLVQDVAS